MDSFWGGTFLQFILFFTNLPRRTLEMQPQLSHAAKPPGEDHLGPKIHKWRKDAANKTLMSIAVVHYRSSFYKRDRELPRQWGGYFGIPKIRKSVPRGELLKFSCGSLNLILFQLVDSFSDWLVFSRQLRGWSCRTFFPFTLLDGDFYFVFNSCLFFIHWWQPIHFLYWIMQLRQEAGNIFWEFFPKASQNHKRSSIF